MTDERSPTERFERLDGDRDDHEERLRRLAPWQIETKTALTLLR
jgi:hypothetical protein